MNKPKAVKQLQTLARKIVGDGKSPNIFFVSIEGVIVTVTKDFNIAYDQWYQTRFARPLKESCLEDRKNGTLASIEPKDDDSKELVIYDDTNKFDI